MKDLIMVFEITARNADDLQAQLRELETNDDGSDCFVVVSVTPFGNTGIDFFVVCR